MECICPVVFVTDQRTTLCHTIAYAVLIFDVMQHLFYFTVERSTTDDQVTQLTAEHLIQTFFHFTTNDILDERSLPKNLHRWSADLRQHTFLDDFLNYQRYSQHHERLHLCKSLHQYSRSRRLREEINLCSFANLIDELKHQTEHVRNRQHRQHFISFLVRNTSVCEFNITTQVKMR